MAKILVIEDDEITREILAAILSTRGDNVILAENGDQGIEFARTEDPDLIVLDMNLPGMTGWDILPVIRSHPKTRKVAVIALTAHDTSESRDKAHEAGCDIYVSKPVDADRLLNAVNSLLN